MVNIKTLNCGVRVATEVIPHVNSAAMGIWVRCGAVDEPRSIAGMSHFIEHMMFKGTEKRNARQIAEDIDKIGGQINAFTGKEATCYYVKTLNTHIFEGAEVLLDMLNNSVFNIHELTREKDVIYEELKMIEDQPDDLAHDTVVARVFKGTPLANSIIGTQTSLTKISGNLMHKFKKENYGRDSIVVSIAGNINEEEIYDYLEDKFEKISDRKTVKPAEIKESKPSFKVIAKDIQQSHLCMAVKTIALDDPKYYSFAVLNNIMGGSMSSRLFQNIREEKGLAYSVYSMNSSFSTSGYYSIYAGIGHDKIEDAINAIKDELDMLELKGVTEEELSMSREQLKSSYIFGQESIASRMFAMGKNLLLLGKVYTEEEIIAGIDKVSLESIDEIKPVICNPDNYCAVCVSNKEFNLGKMVRV